MLKNITSALHTKYGQIVISVILGLGLASLFRKVCDKINCIKFTSPNVSEIQKNTYSHGNDCYTFTSKTKKCSQNKKVSFA